MSAGRDCQALSEDKVFVPLKIRIHVKGTDFDSNISPVSLLPYVNAIVESISWLQIFKGKHLPYRVVRSTERTTRIQSTAYILTAGSLSATRAEMSGTDKHLFAKWSAVFAN